MTILPKQGRHRLSLKVHAKCLCVFATFWKVNPPLSSDSHINLFRAKVRILKVPSPGEIVVLPHLYPLHGIQIKSSLNFKNQSSMIDVITRAGCLIFVSDLVHANSP